MRYFIMLRDEREILFQTTMMSDYVDDVSMGNHLISEMQFWHAFSGEVVMIDFDGNPYVALSLDWYEIQGYEY